MNKPFLKDVFDVFLNSMSNLLQKCWGTTGSCPSSCRARAALWVADGGFMRVLVLKRYKVAKTIQNMANQILRQKPVEKGMFFYSMKEERCFASQISLTLGPRCQRPRPVATGVALGIAAATVGIDLKQMLLIVHGFKWLISGMLRRKTGWQ